MNFSLSPHRSLGYDDEASLTKKLSSYDSHLYNFTHVTREREWIKVKNTLCVCGFIHVSGLENQTIRQLSKTEVQFYKDHAQNISLWFLVIGFATQ